MRPIIGITANYRNDGEMEFSRNLGYPDQKWHALADDYVQAVLRAGGIPVILPVLDAPEAQDPEAARALWEGLLRGVDGVLFSGGSDVDPQRYGRRTSGKTGEIVPQRDQQELLLARYVLEETNLPVLGICRGLQVLNVALGGTLMEDVQAEGHPSHTLHMYPRTERSHTVKVEPGSLLERIVACNELGVNSLHHMAIQEVASALKAVAVSDDGLVEAVELKESSAFRKASGAQSPDRFFLAVQWHPEMMSSRSALQQGIVDAFIAHCGK